MADQIQNIDPPYRKKVYDLLSSKFSDFKRTEDEFYKKLDNEPDYAERVYSLLSSNFSDFSRPKDEFISLVKSGKKKEQLAVDGAASVLSWAGFGNASQLASQYASVKTPTGGTVLSPQDVSGITNYVNELKKKDQPQQKALTPAEANKQYGAAVAAKKSTTLSTPKQVSEITKKQEEIVPSFKKDDIEREAVRRIVQPSFTQSGSNLQNIDISEDPIGDVVRGLQNDAEKAINLSGNPFDVAANKEYAVRNAQARLIAENAFIDFDKAKERLSSRYGPLNEFNNKDSYISPDKLEQSIDKGNMSDMLAFNSYKSHWNISQALLNSNSLEDAAIRYEVSMDKDKAKTVQSLLGVTADKLPSNISLENRIPESVKGQWISEFLYKPEVINRTRTDAKFAQEWKSAEFNLFNHYPEYAKKVVAQIISQAREDQGDGGGLIDIPTKAGLDKLVDKLVKEGKLTEQGRRVYEEQIRPMQGTFRSIGRGFGNIVAPAFVNDNPIKGADFGSNFLDSWSNTIHSMAKSVEDLNPATMYYRSTDNSFNKARLYDILNKEYSMVTVEPKSFFHEVTQTGGHITGFLVPMILGARGLGVAGMSPKAAGLVTNALIFESQNRESALKMFQNSPGKQFLYTVLTTGFDVFAAEALPAVKATRGALNPEIKKVINDFTSGNITAAVAKKTLIEKAADVLSKTPEFLGKNAHTGAVMAGFTSFHDAVDAAFGGRDVSMDEFINNNIHSFRTGFLGSSFINGAAVYGRGSKITGQNLRQMAENYDFFKSKIQGLKGLPEGEIKERLANLNDARLIWRDVNRMDLTDAQKEKMLLSGVAQKVAERESASTHTDAVRESIDQKINALKQAQKDILSGKDDAMDHESMNEADMVEEWKTAVANAKTEAEKQQLNDKYRQMIKEKRQEPVEDAEDYLMVGDVIGRQVKMNGEVGMIYQDGQTLVFKVEGKDKERELGNVYDISADNIAKHGIEKEQSVVSVNEDGNIVVRNKVYVNNRETDMAAVNRAEDGSVSSVVLRDLNGNKRRFKGRVAEDIAYQLSLRQNANPTEAQMEGRDYTVPGQEKQDRLIGMIRDAIMSENAEKAAAAQEALRSTGVRINMISDPNEYDAMATRLGGQRGTEGMFVSSDGQIYINKSKLDQGIADGRLIWHEAAHPVMNIIRNTNPELFGQVVSGLREAAKQNKGVADAVNWVKREYANEEQWRKDDESVVETVAGIAEGTIKIDSLPTSLRQHIIDFVNSISKALGFGEVLKDTDIEAFKKLAGKVAEHLRTGKDVSDIVGKENVTDYNVNIGAPVQLRVGEANGVEVKFSDNHNLSFVTKEDKVDIRSLIKDIHAKGQRVWFWVADQLGRGVYKDQVIDGEHYLDAGPSFALDPENRSKGVIWATGKGEKFINDNISKSDYIFIISGSPTKSKLFNKKVFELVINRIKNVVGEDGAWDKFKSDVLSVSKISEINKILNKYNSFDELLASPDRKNLLLQFDAQREKKGTPLKSLLEKYNAFLDYNDLRDGFYKDNGFEMNDIMLVLKPTGYGGKSSHSTYENDILGEVVGVPDRRINAYEIMPEEVRSKYKPEISRTEQSQVVAPYGSGIKSIQASMGNRPSANTEIIDGFYSPIENRVNEFKQPKASVQKWKEIVGVKSDEAVFSGLADWLNSQKPDSQLSKQDVLNFMKENRIEIREVTKNDAEPNQLYQILDEDGYDAMGEAVDKATADRLIRENEGWSYEEVSIGDNSVSATKYSQYQLPGGENYKEVLITLPSKQPQDYKIVKGRDGKYRIKSPDGTINKGRFWSVRAAAESALALDIKKAKTEFQSTHFDEPNIITHLRMNTRTDADGKKVLFLEEVQSDWGQKGKREGFGAVDASKAEIELKKFESEMIDRYGEGWSDKLTDEEDLNHDRLTERFAAAGGFNKPVSPAPYVTNTNAWVKLGLKFALKEAVKQGADRIAWTTGEQQFKRWGSEEIHWETILKPKGFDIVVKDKSKAPVVRGNKVTMLSSSDGSYNPQAELKRISEEWGINESDLEVRPARGQWNLAINEQTDAEAFAGNEAALRDSRLQESDIVVNNKEELRDALGRNLGRERSDSELNKLTDRVWERMQIEDNGSSMPRKEGMQSFYGDAKNPGIVANVAKALVKELTGRDGKLVESKVDTKTIKADIDLGDGWETGVSERNLTNQPSIEITPELRQAVEEGMPQFSVGNRTPKQDLINDLLSQGKISKEEYDAYNRVAANVEMAAPKDDGFLRRHFGTESSGEFHINAVDKLARQFTDPYRVFVKAIDFLTGGQKVKPSEDPITFLRLINGFDAKFDEVARNGMIDAEGNLMKSSGGDAMNIKWLLKPLAENGRISKEEFAENVKSVVAYMIAERTVELAKRFDRDQVLTGIGDGQFTDLETAQQTLNTIKALPNASMIMEAADRYRELADASLRYMVDKGRLAEAVYDKDGNLTGGYQFIKQNNLQYVAMRRVMETEPGQEVNSGFFTDKTIGSVSQPVKTIKGSNRKISNPYVSLLDNVYKTMRESDRNEILLTFRNLLQQASGPDIGEMVDKPIEGKTVTIFVDGKPEYWALQKDVYTALKGLDDAGYKLPGAVTLLPKIMRWTVTHFPVFALRNFVRDWESRMIISGNNPLESIKNSITLKKNWGEAARMGALNSGVYTQGKEIYYEMLKDAEKDMTKRGMVILTPEVFKRVWHKYERLLFKSETTGRVSEYQASYKKAKSEGMSDYDARLYAATQSRALIDFAVMGNTMRVVNQLIPFSNAAIQGLRSAAKSINKSPAKFAMRVALFSLAPEAIVWMLNNQSDDKKKRYENLPDYQRDMYYNIPIGNYYISIPKPFELSLPGSGFSRGLSFAEGNEKAFDGYAGTVYKSLSPFSYSDATGPMATIVEILANKDFFRDSRIVPPYEENKNLELRNTDQASRLSKIIGSVINADPRYIDHFIKSQFTYFGDAAVKASNIGDKDARDKFGLSSTGFVKEYSAYNSKPVKELIEYVTEWGLESDGMYKTFKDLATNYFNSESAEEKESRGKYLINYAESLLDVYKEGKVDQIQILKADARRLKK